MPQETCYVGLRAVSLNHWRVLIFPLSGSGGKAYVLDPVFTVPGMSYRKSQSLLQKSDFVTTKQCEFKNNSRVNTLPSK